MAGIPHEHLEGPDTSYVLGMHVESKEFFEALADGELQSATNPEFIPDADRAQDDPTGFSGVSRDPETGMLMEEE